MGQKLGEVNSTDSSIVIRGSMLRISVFTHSQECPFKNTHTGYLPRLEPIFLVENETITNNNSYCIKDLLT